MEHINKFFLGLLAAILFVACKDSDKEPVLPTEQTFPFMKVGNQWNYVLKTDEGETEISYKIADKTKENYYKVMLDFVDSGLPAMEHYWFADATMFTMVTDWPDSPAKLTMLTKGCKVGDHWDYFVPASLDPEDDELSGNIRYKILEANVSMKIAGTTYTDVYTVHHTASSHPGYYTNFFISLLAGMLKADAVGYTRDENNELVYFPVDWILKSKNF